jgi:hypothetical protein
LSLLLSSSARWSLRTTPSTPALWILKPGVSSTSDPVGGGGLVDSLPYSFVV